MDAITKALEISARTLCECDTAERSPNWGTAPRSHGLHRVTVIRDAARKLADACLDGADTTEGHEAFTAAVSLLGRALEGREDEPLEPLAIDERSALVQNMYARLLAILHVAGSALSPEQYSASAGVLNELAVLIDIVGADSGEDGIDGEIDDFCTFAEPVFEGLSLIFAGGDDER